MDYFLKTKISSFIEEGLNAAVKDISLNSNLYVLDLYEKKSSGLFQLIDDDR